MPRLAPATGAATKPSNGSSRRAAPQTDARDASKTAERILAVAIREFASKGFAGARVEQIAKRARVNKQLLYYYFGGKKGLYDAAVSEAYRQSTAAWADLADLDYTDRMVALASRQNESAAMVLSARIMLWEALQSGAGQVKSDDPVSTNWSYGRQEVKAAQERGDVHPHLDTDLLTLVMAAVLLVPHTNPVGIKALTGRMPSDPELLARHGTFMRDFMTLLTPAEPPAAPPVGRSGSKARRT